MRQFVNVTVTLSRAKRCVYLLRVKELAAEALVKPRRGWARAATGALGSHLPALHGKDAMHISCGGKPARSVA